MSDEIPSWGKKMFCPASKSCSLHLLLVLFLHMILFSSSKCPRLLWLRMPVSSWVKIDVSEGDFISTKDLSCFLSFLLLESSQKRVLFQEREGLLKTTVSHNEKVRERRECSFCSLSCFVTNVWSSKLNKRNRQSFTLKANSISFPFLCTESKC